MSSAVKTVAPIAAGAVGAYFGGPAGAMAGYQLGSAATGAFGNKGQAAGTPGLPQMPQAGVISPQAQTQGANPLGGFTHQDAASQQAPGTGGKGALLSQGLMMAGELQNAKLADESREALLSKNQAEIELMGRQGRPFVQPGQPPQMPAAFTYGR